MTSKKRFLIPDGYSKESRDEFDRVGMTLAGKLYASLLMKRMPDAEYDIWYSSDPGVEAPTDEELEGLQAIAVDLLARTGKQLDEAVTDGTLQEICS